MKKYAAWWLPLIFLLLITPFTPYLDLSLSRFWYDRGAEYPDHFVQNSFFSWMYSYGVIPADLLMAAAVLIFLFSYVIPRWKSWRTAALLVLLTFAIGAGVIVHGVLKDHWGRPRPRQTVEFGGTEPFRPYYEPNFAYSAEKFKSFSCGHCTMGFGFFALVFAGRRMNRRWMSAAGWILAFGLGFLLSLTRIAQGGHFFSDTLVSALIMWWTALTFDALLFDSQRQEQ